MTETNCVTWRRKNLLLWMKSPSPLYGALGGACGSGLLNFIREAIFALTRGDYIEFKFALGAGMTEIGHQACFWREGQIANDRTCFDPVQKIN